MDRWIDDRWMVDGWGESGADEGVLCGKNWASGGRQEKKPITAASAALGVGSQVSLLRWALALLHLPELRTKRILAIPLFPGAFQEPKIDHLWTERVLPSIIAFS